jgi:hypothetical protein
MPSPDRYTKYYPPAVLERLTNGTPAVKVDAGRPLRRTAFLLSPIGWEVMQLVAWQTLTLLILVRVQASQPNFS